MTCNGLTEPVTTVLVRTHIQLSKLLGVLLQVHGARNRRVKIVCQQRRLPFVSSGRRRRSSLGFKRKCSRRRVWHYCGGNLTLLLRHTCPSLLTIKYSNLACHDEAILSHLFFLFYLLAMCSLATTPSLV